MTMKTIMYNGHRIDVKLLFTEKVFYDGRQMTSKFTVFGGTHVFRVEEDGESVTYEIEIHSGFMAPWIKIRRNGIVIYTDN